MLLRCIAPLWLREENPQGRRVLEGDFTEEQWHKFNAEGYNVYFLPNCPSEYSKGVTVDGSKIDTFSLVFVDYDCKSNNYPDKDSFLARLGDMPVLPSSIIDSGNGIHAYWAVSDLDAMSYLRLSRRMMRLLHTDESVGQIFQLMRLPGSVNTKNKDDLKLCETLFSQDKIYTCEELDSILPPITQADEDYCKQHYEKTYKLKQDIEVDDKIPVKFAKLVRENSEVRDIWSGNVDDRSKADWRLGHLMFASGFIKAEAMSVLVNSAKALARAPKHRVGYAQNIVDKIWTYEIDPQKSLPSLSESVKDILARSGENLKGTRFSCHPVLDNTVHGFRLGQVIGLVAGSGVGKTTVAVNMFRWFVERNPEYDHMFVSLEQPANEIAERWRTVSQGDDRLHDKVHVISNYESDGSFRHLSLDDIREYILNFQKSTGKKIGTVVIDHIGALKTKTKDGQNQGIIDICHKMKSFAVETNTLVIMQSQAPREKAGIGDLELNKDAAYGTVFFESYVDYLLLCWQPVKRLYSRGAPTTLAYKFGKIRHKKQGEDVIQEDVRYCLYFDTNTEQLREMTQSEEKSLAWFNAQAIKLRKEDRKLELIEYVSLRPDKKEGINAEADTGSSKDSGTVESSPDLH